MDENTEVLKYIPQDDSTNLTSLGNFCPRSGQRHEHLSVNLTLRLEAACNDAGSASNLHCYFFGKKKAIATNVIPQNRSIISHHNVMTAYHVIDDRKPSFDPSHLWLNCLLNRDAVKS
ncbi:hypothetical protein Tco_0286263 [Tanacetum coccineum]